MTQLLIATNNKGKIEELQDLLKDTGIDPVTPAQINLELDVIEDGLTYTENATKKALAFALASGLISLADDSGLEVDALSGAPGLYSARYGSPNGGKLSDGERRKYLISKLLDKPHPWTARFKATIAIAVPFNNVTLNRATLAPRSGRKSTRMRRPGASAGEGLLLSRNEKVHLFEGTCEGEIIPEERGTGGFGYDPIFLFPELGKTMAELSRDEKNRLSHRARAVMKARIFLNNLPSNVG